MLVTRDILHGKRFNVRENCLHRVTRTLTPTKGKPLAMKPLCILPNTLYVFFFMSSISSVYPKSIHHLGEVNFYVRVVTLY
jgi:hypothetical protein